MLRKTQPVATMERELTEFQKALIAARADRSYREFARLTDLPFSTIRRLEQGLTESPDQSTLDALSEVMPYTPDELRAMTENRKPEPLRPVVSAQDVINLIENFDKAEIKKLLKLIIDEYLD